MPHFKKKKRKFAAPFNMLHFSERPEDTFCPQLLWAACTILSNCESYCMATQLTTPPIYASREWVILCNEIMPSEESMCPCRVKASWNNPSHEELPWLFQDELWFAGPTLDFLHGLHQSLHAVSMSRDTDWCNQVVRLLSYTGKDKANRNPVDFYGSSWFSTSAE